MIGRYTRPEMGKIWSNENRLRQMLQVEVLACEALCSLGQIPKEDFEQIRDKADFDE
ncbi:MAG: adenylosuccinate lyase, partial [Clostridia bacterium]|nr:adenylosuccinate lyase [Clostridia bacterium]